MCNLNNYKLILITVEWIIFQYFPIGINVLGYDI